MERERYYIKTNDNDGKLFIFVYDEELSNDKNGVCPDFKNKRKYDQKELEDLGMKSDMRGSWSEKEQDRYNDLWMKLHKKG